MLIPRFQALAARTQRVDSAGAPSPTRLAPGFPFRPQQRGRGTPGLTAGLVTPDQLEGTETCHAVPVAGLPGQGFAAPQGSVAAVTDAIPGEYQPVVDVRMLTRQ